MSAFVSQWADWQPKTPTVGPDKTDKSPSVSSVSESPRHIPPQEGGKTLPKRLRTLTDKADKRCSPGGRAVLLQSPEDIPEAWAQGVADLLVMPAPADWPAARWATLQGDARAFLEAWGGQALRLGWDAANLFNVHAAAPHARLDGMGLVPLLGGRPVVALTEDSAAIKASAGTLTYRRRQTWPVACCLVWELYSEHRKERP